MENIFNFLNNVWLDLKTENNTHFSFIPFIFLCCTIPLSLGINNVFLGLFVLSVLLKPKQFCFQFVLGLPILLFLLYTASISWSIDVAKSIKSLPKELGLLIIPVMFMIMKPFSEKQVHKIMKYYSFTMVLYVVFYLIKAIIRYIDSGNQDVFFYHELVTEPVNAIHVSVYVAMAFFYFFNSYSKNRFEVFITFLLFAFLILLSSKNILVVFSVLVVINYLTVVRKRVNRKIEITVILLIPVIAFLFFGKIKDRFDEEFQSNYSHNSSISQFENVFNGSNAISVKEAWNNEQFTPNDYFSGLAFRVFQIRVFYELLAEEPIIWKGFGLNAAQIKIDEKVGNYNLFKGNEDQDGYLNKNFHNQYIQVFAEIGFFGFLIIVTMLFFNTIKTIKNKDFIQIAFAVLMISLFLTESLLSRQRGIMFFVLLFCLFNSKKANAPETK